MCLYICCYMRNALPARQIAVRHLLWDEAVALAHGECRLEAVALAGRQEGQQRLRLELSIQLDLCKMDSNGVKGLQFARLPPSNSSSASGCSAYSCTCKRVVHKLWAALTMGAMFVLQMEQQQSINARP